MSDRSRAVALLASLLVAAAACSQRTPAPSASARCPEGMVPDGSGALCVDRSAVTIGEFNTCGPCVASHGFVPGATDAPMTSARPDEIAAYCRGIGRRLPTDATAGSGFRCVASPLP